MSTDLPRWEAWYQPGNVSDYFIGWLNDPAPAKAAAIAWMKSQMLEEPGPLRWDRFDWDPKFGHDVEYRLREIAEDGTETESGILVQRRVDKPEDDPTLVHVYLSTACGHGECGSCRTRCKFCSSTCGHHCHSGDATPPAPVSSVDQARQIAREMYQAPGFVSIAPDLDERIKADPDLFWLRPGPTTHPSK